MNKTPRREKKAVGRIKMFIILVSVMMLGIAALGTTLAYLSDSTNPIANIFNPSNMDINIDEGFDKEVKTNVKVQNTGDTTAYIRAKIVVTWQNGTPGKNQPAVEGENVYPVAPVAGTDYTIEYGAGWVKIGEFWYHKAPVAGGAETSVLITRCEPVAANTPEGYGLNVEILSQSIQSEPTSVVKDAWKVTLDDNDEITAGGTN